jgi:hypothetical protein
MSAHAIAAVTATMRSLLQKNVRRAEVTTLPLDKTSTGNTAARLNLFLYHMTPNASWRNQPIPTKVRPGEAGIPPIALNLYYLLTAYGDDQTDEADHRLLGEGMQALYDHPVLTPKDISDATSAVESLREARLERQFEHVRVTLETLSLEEMSKLWTAFQTQYRISAAYQASVVLVESARPLKTPLPVLKRGERDQGADVFATFPGVLEGIEYRDLRTRVPAFPAAQLGDTVTLLGRRLPGRNAKVVFVDPNRISTETEPERGVVARLSPEIGSDDERVFVKLDESAESWVSGPLLVAIEQELSTSDAQISGKRIRRTNTLRFALAPRLRDDAGLSFLTINEQGRRKLVLRCQPRITELTDGTLPDVSLLLTPTNSSRAPDPVPLDLNSKSRSAATPAFDIDRVPPGEYRVRLRIDTVESLVMRRDGNRIEFDETQKVTL